MNEPAWKKVACPVCKAQPGERCVRRDYGRPPERWARVAPHKWRKDEAPKDKA